MPSENAQQGQLVSVLGAGSWGTALALQLVDNGHNVTLWGRDAKLLEEITQTHCNSVYLPGCQLPHNLHTQNDLVTAVNSSRIIVVAIPSTAIQAVGQKMADEITSRQEGIILASKGIEPRSATLAHEVLEKMMKPKIPIACLSGPSFAEEVAKRAPTAVTISSQDGEFAEKSAALFHNQNFRVYTSDDIIGAEVAGAFKNIIAIATGISDGLGFGTNARAALITRGLSEICRLAEAMGGKVATLYGLAGVGDLVLTCTSNQSRNRRFGLLIAEGRSIDEASKKINQATEGVSSAIVAQQLAQRYNVEMPICEQVNKLISGEIKPRRAVQELLGRPSKSED